MSRDPREEYLDGHRFLASPAHMPLTVVDGIEDTSADEPPRKRLVCGIPPQRKVATDCC